MLYLAALVRSGEKQSMTQAERNRAEWENPANWSDSLVGIYFSKRDSRVWVPKRRPGFGWTINMGHPRSAWWVVGLVAAPFVLSGLLCRRKS